MTLSPYAPPFEGSASRASHIMGFPSSVGIGLNPRAPAFDSNEPRASSGMRANMNPLAPSLAPRSASFEGYVAPVAPIYQGPQFISPALLDNRNNGEYSGTGQLGQVPVHNYNTVPAHNYNTVSGHIFGTRQPGGVIGLASGPLNRVSPFGPPVNNAYFEGPNATFRRAAVNTASPDSLCIDPRLLEAPSPGPINVDARRPETASPSSLNIDPRLSEMIASPNHINVYARLPETGSPSPLDIDPRLPETAFPDDSNVDTRLENYYQQPTPPEDHSSVEGSTDVSLDLAPQTNKTAQDPRQKSANGQQSAATKRGTSSKTPGKGAVTRKPAKSKAIKSCKPKGVRKKEKAKVKVKVTEDHFLIKFAIKNLPEPTTEEVVEYKLKKAGAVIKRQKRELDPAKRQGAEVSITRSSTGVHFGGVYWRAPSIDETIPTTQARFIACVEMVVKAIRNYDDCREVEESKEFLNRWAPGATHYTADEIHAAAHDIVATMMDVHRNGWTKVIYDRNIRELYQKTLLFTFEERLHGVLVLLTASKTTCADLMKGERLYAIVGNPYELIKRTASNKSSNYQKKGRITIGTKVQKQEKHALEAAERAEGDGENDLEPVSQDVHHNKPARRTQPPVAKNQKKRAREAEDEDLREDEDFSGASLAIKDARPTKRPRRAQPAKVDEQKKRAGEEEVEALEGDEEESVMNDAGSMKRPRRTQPAGPRTQPAGPSQQPAGPSKQPAGARKQPAKASRQKKRAREEEEVEDPEEIAIAPAARPTKRARSTRAT